MQDAFAVTRVMRAAEEGDDEPILPPSEIHFEVRVDTDSKHVSCEWL